MATAARRTRGLNFPQELEPQVIVTRHALDRYSERARAEVAAHRAAEMTGHVLEGLEEGSILRAATGIHLLPVRSSGGRWLCLVLGVKGTIEEPHSVIIYTVLTQAMAIETFGHVIGLIGAMSGPRCRGAAA
jgi:hypothetical protein